MFETTVDEVAVFNVFQVKLSSSCLIEVALHFMFHAFLVWWGNTSSNQIFLSKLYISITLSSTVFNAVLDVVLSHIFALFPVYCFGHLIKLYIYIHISSYI